MEKVTRRTMKRWAGEFSHWLEFALGFHVPFLPFSPLFLLRCSHSTILPPVSVIDYSQDHMELGAIWNGFSLNESGELAEAIEKTGQAIDTTYMSTVRLVSCWIHVICE
jgi:hypothetical protein